MTISVLYSYLVSFYGLLDSCAEATPIQWLAGLFGDDAGIDVYLSWIEFSAKQNLVTVPSEVIDSLLVPVRCSRVLNEG
jgi:hypothetical protein